MLGTMTLHTRERPRHPGPFARFRRDHTRVIAWLAAMESAAPGRGLPVREDVLHRHVARLRHQFATHMAAEESVVYPALAEAFPEARASLGPLNEEHADLAEMLDDLESWLARPASRERDVQIAVQVRDFVDLLRVHIRKEETLVFDVSERVLGARHLRELAQRLVPFDPARTRRGPAHPPTGEERC